MQSVFGRGQMDLQAALAPVLGLDISATQGLFAADASQLNAGPILYGPLKAALAGLHISASDRFDGARFLIDGASFISTITPPTLDMMTDNLEPKRLVSDLFGLHHYLASGRDRHISDQHPERLFDLQAGPKEAIYILDKASLAFGQNQTGWTLRYGQQEQSQSLSALWRQEGTHHQFWLGQGAGDQKTGWFDSNGDGAFTLNGAQSLWQFAGFQQTVGRFQFQAEGLFGKSWLKSGSGLLRSGEVDVQSWLLQMHTEIGQNHRLSFSYGQPLNATRGMVELYAGNGEETRKLQFKNHKKEHQSRIGWDYQPLEGIDMSAYYLEIQNPASGLAESEYRFGAQLRLSF